MLGVLTLAPLLFACASNSMVYSDSEPAPKAGGGAVYLMTISLKNLYAPKYQPNVSRVVLEGPGAGKEPEEMDFGIDDKALVEPESAENGVRYLVRMQLKPGKYRLLGARGLSQGFLINGRFFAPMHMDFEAVADGVFYLGDVTGINRERVGEEFRSGSVIPLMDQAVTGYAHGTFDINVSDRYDLDMKLFRERFPNLGQQEVTRQILPAFDRSRAQTYWDKPASQ